MAVFQEFFRNLLCQHHHQQYQQENINQQQQQTFKQFTSPPPNPAMSETFSVNAFDETEENGFDQQNVNETILYQQLLVTGPGKKKIRELLPEHVYHPDIHFRS